MIRKLSYLNLTTFLLSIGIVLFAQWLTVEAEKALQNAERFRYKAALQEQEAVRQAILARKETDVAHSKMEVVRLESEKILRELENCQK